MFKVLQLKEDLTLVVNEIYKGKAGLLEFGHCQRIQNVKF